MSIVTDFGSSAKEYTKDMGGWVFPRPRHCPHCKGKECLIGHGYYPRQACEGKDVYRLRIKRWYCKICQHTTSLLGSFLLSYRHYTLAAIEQIIRARYELGYSWSQIVRRYTWKGVPSVRTMKRWCHSFAEQAARWWAAIQSELAEYDSGSPNLNPLGEGSNQAGWPRALLEAAIHLLAWGKTKWAELADYGLNERLRFMWQWGHERGLGRLI